MIKVAKMPWTPLFTRIDMKNLTFSIKDGGSESIDITVGEGNFTFSEKKNIEYIMDRGTLDDVRAGDEVPMDVSFQFTWDYYTGSSATGADPTPHDALKQQGNASAWVSTDADPCRPYSVDLQILNVPNCDTADQETFTFPDFRYESLDGDSKVGTISCTGKCNATEPTVVRAAQP